MFCSARQGLLCEDVLGCGPIPAFTVKGRDGLPALYRREILLCISALFISVGGSQ